MAAVKLPALVAHGWPIVVVAPGRTAGGWAVFEFASVAAARAFMCTNPQAAMPCWRRPDLFAAEEAAERAAAERAPCGCSPDEIRAGGCS